MILAAPFNVGQFVATSVVASLIGLMILVVLRYALRGARDTILKEFTSNGGESAKDKIDATAADVRLLRRQYETHLWFDHHRESTGL